MSCHKIHAQGRYVSQEDIKQFGSLEKRQQDLSEDGWLGQEWLAKYVPSFYGRDSLTTISYSSTALVSLGPHLDSPRLSFTHGSLRPSFANLLPYPEAINNLGYSLLSKALSPPLALPYPPNPYPGLPKGSSAEEADLYAEGGPLWWRGLAQMPDEKVVCGWANELKEKLGVRRIIGVSWFWLRSVVV